MVLNTSNPGAQEDLEFKASLGYIARLSQTNKREGSRAGKLGLEMKPLPLRCEGWGPLSQQPTKSGCGRLPVTRALRKQRQDLPQASWPARLTESASSHRSPERFCL